MKEQDNAKVLYWKMFCLLVVEHHDQLFSDVGCYKPLLTNRIDSPVTGLFSRLLHYFITEEPD